MVSSPSSYICFIMSMMLAGGTYSAESQLTKLRGGAATEVRMKIAEYLGVVKGGVRIKRLRAARDVLAALLE